MKNTAFALLALLVLPSFASAEEVPATHRVRGDALRADGLFEEAVVEYKRALVERQLLPSEPGKAVLRGDRPLCDAISRHRTEIGSRLEGR